MEFDAGKTPGAISFEWHEEKRRINIQKHGIDFVAAARLFANEHIDTESKFFGEPRRQLTGMLGDRFVTVVYTVRGQNIRLISARPARDNERRMYRAIYARGNPSKD